MSTKTTEIEDGEDDSQDVFDPYAYQQLQLQSELLKAQVQLLNQVATATENLWRLVYCSVLLLLFFLIPGVLGVLLPVVGALVGLAIWFGIWLCMRRAFPAAKKVGATKRAK